MNDEIFIEDETEYLIDEIEEESKEEWENEQYLSSPSMSSLGLTWRDFL